MPVVVCMDACCMFVFCLNEIFECCMEICVEYYFSTELFLSFFIVIIILFIGYDYQ